MMYGLTWRYFFRRKKTFGIAVVMIVLSFLIPLLGVKDYHSFSQMGMIDEAYFLNQQDNLFAQLFVYLLPLLFGFLFGDIWINQRKMGDILTIRADRNKLFFSNWIITLILGFLSVMAFLVLTLIFTLIMTNSPATDIHVNVSFLPEFAYHMLQQSVLFPELYINQPVLWLGLYIILVSLYGGVVASLCFVIGGMIKNKYIAFLLPFFLMMLLMIVLSVMNNGANYSIQNMLFIGSSVFDHHMELLIAHFLSLTALSLVLGIAARRK